MPNLRDRAIVDTAWLAQHLDAPDLVVLDGSWHMPAENRDAQREYRDSHIPGALFFDIDALSDEKSPLPHMLPSSTKFASNMRKMGIGDGMRVVVYDTSKPGLMSAARVWWMFRVMGHEDVAVLDGGYKKWTAEGRPLTSEPTTPRTARHFTARLNASLLRDIEDMRALAAAGPGSPGKPQIIDARSSGRFEGRDPEPRPGLRGGHIPGSRNVPFTVLLNADGTLKSKGELERAFADAGVDIRKPIVTSCGSGVTATVLSLALAALGQPGSAVYDGSWSEWGQSTLDTPVATGPA